MDRDRQRPPIFHLIGVKPQPHRVLVDFLTNLLRLLPLLALDTVLQVLPEQLEAGDAVLLGN